MSAAPRMRAYVGLGSNLAEPVAQIERALDALAALTETTLAARSSLYVNPPMGPADQPDYVNAVAALDTALAPHALLDGLQAIEAAGSRTREGARWGPRTLDLDLLLFGERRIDDHRLRVPHPGIAERAFVLLPLAEIAPASLPVPGLATLGELLAACDTSAMRRLETVP